MLRSDLAKQAYRHLQDTIDTLQHELRKTDCPFDRDWIQTDIAVVSACFGLLTGDDKDASLEEIAEAVEAY